MRVIYDISEDTRVKDISRIRKKASPHIFRDFRIALDSGKGRIFVRGATLDIIHLLSPSLQ